MKYWLNNWKRRIFIALAIIGPGIITAFADNDAAGVATYSVSAATFGYRMLIITIPMTILLAVTQEIGARIAIVAEKGLADLIRERFGVKIALVMFGLLFLVNMAVVVQNVSAIKAALRLFGLNPTFFLPAIVAGLFLFVTLAKYSVVERFFFVLIGFYGTYIASAWLAKPDWALAAQSMIIPEGPYTPHFLFTAIAVLGTTITAWGQFFINSYVKDKRVPLEHLKYNRLEVYLGAVFTNTFSFFMMVAVAATLFVNRIPITGAADAALAIRPFAGDLAGILFGGGLLAAGILGCIIVPMTTAYAYTEFFGYSGSLDEKFHESRQFYTMLLIQLTLALIITMFPGVSLFAITLMGNFFNGIILPVIFYFLYQFANNEAIMGAHVNNKAQNWMLGGSSGVILVAVVLSIVGQLMGW